MPTRPSRLGYGIKIDGFRPTLCVTETIVVFLFVIEAIEASFFHCFFKTASFFSWSQQWPEMWSLTSSLTRATICRNLFLCWRTVECVSGGRERLLHMSCWTHLINCMTMGHLRVFQLRSCDVFLCWQGIFSVIIVCRAIREVHITRVRLLHRLKEAVPKEGAVLWFLLPARRGRRLLRNA